MLGRIKSELRGRAGQARRGAREARGAGRPEAPGLWRGGLPARARIERVPGSSGALIAGSLGLFEGSENLSNVLERT